MYDIVTLSDMLVSELRKVADELDVKHKGLKKQDLIYKILEVQAVTVKAAPPKPEAPVKNEAARPESKPRNKRPEKKTAPKAERNGRDSSEKVGKGKNSDLVIVMRCN